MLALVSSERFVEHTPPPGHPERPERAEVFDVVAAAWREAGGLVLSPRAATREEIARVHAPGYLARLDQLRGRAAMLDPDTFTSPESVELAALAAGGALTALEWVLAAPGGNGAPRRALALVRPPGHHAEPDRAMGFCFLNNIAIAAHAALAAGMERVAIVDYDVHHGNGTERAFAADPRVLFVSTHQSPFYPGTGPASDIGTGAGAGYTVNIPLEAGCTEDDYARVFDRIVVPIVDEFAPELVLVSAGFDAEERDPLAQMRLTPAAFARLTQQLADVADRRASGRLLAVTEGGYDLVALRESLEAVVGVLAGTRPPARDPHASSTPRADRAIDAVRRAQAARWRGL